MSLLVAGWPDFFMTIAEAVLPKVGLYGAARAVAERHYATAIRRPGKKEYILATIYESAGDAANAEEFYNRAINISPGFADYRIFLGLFLMRQRRVDEAMRAFEKAKPLAQNESTLEFIESQISKLRG